MKEEDKKKAIDHVENVTLNSCFIIFITLNILNHIVSQINDGMKSLALKM